MENPFFWEPVLASMRATVSDILSLSPELFLYFLLRSVVWIPTDASINAVPFFIMHLSELRQQQLHVLEFPQTKALSL